MHEFPLIPAPGTPQARVAGCICESNGPYNERGFVARATPEHLKHAVFIAAGCPLHNSRNTPDAITMHELKFKP